MKTLVTSSYATNASSNYAAAWQRDHNYFIPAATKPAIYQAIKDRFQAMWTNSGVRAISARSRRMRRPSPARRRMRRTSPTTTLARLEHRAVRRQLRRLPRARRTRT